jgi:tripartite-type tricarboxylate transporter receptor subunit TctC
MALVTRRSLVAIAAATATLGLGPMAFAQGYPAKPITLIVPFAAGGPTDVVSRLVGEHMSRTLGQQIVVENVAGAGGSTGMARVAAAAPDGYIIGMGNAGTQGAAPALYPELKYDPAKSFDQIGIANFTPMAIVAKKDLAPADLPSFIQFLKANSDKMSYGHAGVGSTSHVAGILFNGQFGFKPALVAYRGTGPALNDLVAGTLDYMVDQSLNSIPQVQAGTIKAYAVAADSRLSAMPNVPTTKELGVDFVFRGFNAMVAPKGLPADVRAKLVDALDKAISDPAILKRYEELGSTAPQGAERGPAGLQKVVEAELARVTPALKSVAEKK